MAEREGLKLILNEWVGWMPGMCWGKMGFLFCLLESVVVWIVFEPIGFNLVAWEI